MASKLQDYLTRISGDAAALKLFHTDPDKAVQGAGLTPEEVAAVRSKNPGAIALALKKAGVGGAAADDINVTIVVVVAP